MVVRAALRHHYNERQGPAITTDRVAQAHVSLQQSVITALLVPMQKKNYWPTPVLVEIRGNKHLEPINFPRNRNCAIKEAGFRLAGQRARRQQEGRGQQEGG